MRSLVSFLVRGILALAYHLTSALMLGLFLFGSTLFFLAYHEHAAILLLLGGVCLALAGMLLLLRVSGEVEAESPQKPGRVIMVNHDSVDDLIPW